MFLKQTYTPKKKKEKKNIYIYIQMIFLKGKL